MSNKGQLLQDPFLNTLRREHVPVSIYLVNGIKLQGQIESFDQYVVLLRNTVTQMVYKHAISTIVPGRAVNFSAAESDDARRLSVAPSAAVRSAALDHFLACLTRLSEVMTRQDGAVILVGVDLGLPHFDAELEELGLLAQTAGLTRSPASSASARRPTRRCSWAAARPTRSSELAADARRQRGPVRPVAEPGAAAQPRAPPRRCRSTTAPC